MEAGRHFGGAVPAAALGGVRVEQTFGEPVREPLRRRYRGSRHRRGQRPPDAGRPPPSPGPEVARPRGPLPALADRVPDLVAGYLAFVAVFCAVTALIPPLRAPLTWLQTAIEVISVEAPPNLATAAFLGILAAAVRRRMIAAWWVLVIYLVLEPALQLAVDLSLRRTRRPPIEVSIRRRRRRSVLRVAFGLLWLAVLVIARDRFTAHTQPGSGRRALAWWLGLLVLGILVGFGLLIDLPRHASHRRRPARVGGHATCWAGSATRSWPGRRAPDRAFDHVPVRALRRGGPAGRRRTCCSGRGATGAGSAPTTSSGSACCSTGTATRTRSGTSPPAATRPRSSRRRGKSAVTLPGRLRRQPGQRRPDRGQRGVAGRDRGLARRGAATSAGSRR